VVWGTVATQMASGGLSYRNAMSNGVRSLQLKSMFVPMQRGQKCWVPLPLSYTAAVLLTACLLPEVSAIPAVDPSVPTGDEPSTPARIGAPQGDDAQQSDTPPRSNGDAGLGSMDAGRAPVARERPGSGGQSG
jgi:hypothetical protein